MASPSERRESSPRRLLVVALIAPLLIVAACLALSSISSADVPAGAHVATAARCKAKAKAARSASAKRCKMAKKKSKKGKHAKSKTTKTTSGKTSKPSSGSAPSSQPTMSPSPANLTPAERKLFEAVNEERAEQGVAALSTSAPLQAISEKRAHEMAEMESDYAGHDVYVDIENAGLCTKSQREISGVELSQAGREAEERLEQEHLHGRPLLQPFAFPALAASSLLSSEEEEAEIPLEAKWVVLGVGVVESGSYSYFTEDFAEPC